MQRDQRVDAVKAAGEMLVSAPACNIPVRMVGPLESGLKSGRVSEFETADVG